MTDKLAWSLMFDVLLQTCIHQYKSCGSLRLCTISTISGYGVSLSVHEPAAVQYSDNTEGHLLQQGHGLQCS